MHQIQPKIDRIERDILQLAGLVDPEKAGYSRLSFSLQDLQARELVRTWMETEANLAVRVDAAGNMIGRTVMTSPGATFQRSPARRVILNSFEAWEIGLVITVIAGEQAVTTKL